MIVAKAIKTVTVKSTMLMCFNMSSNVLNVIITLVIRLHHTNALSVKILDIISMIIIVQLQLVIRLIVY